MLANRSGVLSRTQKQVTAASSRRGDDQQGCHGRCVTSPENLRPESATPLLGRHHTVTRHIYDYAAQAHLPHAA
jgi:hypothetical protein